MAYNPHSYRPGYSNPAVYYGGPPAYSSYHTASPYPPAPQNAGYPGGMGRPMGAAGYPGGMGRPMGMKGGGGRGGYSTNPLGGPQWPVQGGGDWRIGDWSCPHCGKQNFARRTDCFQCGSPKSGNFGGAPPMKRRRLAEGECPPLHPCVRVFGFCKVGPTCPFAAFPSNACLLFLKGKCRFGERCLEIHYAQEADGSFQAIQGANPDAAAPPPDGCHPCVRVYGHCNLGNVCHFASIPMDACLMHLKGRCRFGDTCKERHLTEEELAAYFPGGVPR